jgi:hypothetical protein
MKTRENSRAARHPVPLLAHLPGHSSEQFLHELLLNAAIRTGHDRSQLNL